MRFGWRRLHPGETNHELIWLLVGLTSSLVGIVWLAWSLPVPLCGLKQFTGIPCPGCGATRCCRALFHGDLPRALAMNPLVFAAAAFYLLYMVYSAIIIIFRLPRLRVVSITPRWARGLRIGAIVIILANWLWLVVDGR